MKCLLVPQIDSNGRGGLHRINGLIAPQLEKVIITRGFTKLRVFFAFVLKVFAMCHIFAFCVSFPCMLLKLWR